MAAARVSFSQLLFRNQADAQKGLAQLATRSPDELGDPRMLERDHTEADAQAVTSQFGDAFNREVFGLLHGFGFAGELSEIGLPQGRFPLALLFFNIGVELGQLVFVATALSLVVLIRHIRFDFPGWAARVPPYAIGGLAMFWVIQRVEAS